MTEFVHTTFKMEMVISVNMLRVIRVIRFIPLLVSYSPQLKMSLQALYRSRVAAFNLCAFLFVIVLVYALIGFGAFKNASAPPPPQNEEMSFDNIMGAIFILIQISTSAGWDGNYEQLIGEYHPFNVFVYFWSFLFICIMIIMNLMLTIILCYYKLASEMEFESTDLSAADRNDFIEKWKAISAPNRPLFIHKAQLPALINSLGKSSALRSGFVITDENIQLLGIPMHNQQQLYYGEVLIALNKNRLKQTLGKNGK